MTSPSPRRKRPIEASPRTKKKAAWYTRITRDIVLLTGGLIGVTHETLAQEAERPFLLALFGGMMGLPVFLRRDEGSQ